MCLASDDSHEMLFITEEGFRQKFSLEGTYCFSICLEVVRKTIKDSSSRPTW
jgi:hypothetical protein